MARGHFWSALEFRYTVSVDKRIGGEMWRHFIRYRYTEMRSSDGRIHFSLSLTLNSFKTWACGWRQMHQRQQESTVYLSRRRGQRRGRGGVGGLLLKYFSKKFEFKKKKIRIFLSNFSLIRMSMLQENSRCCASVSFTISENSFTHNPSDAPATSA